MLRDFSYVSLFSFVFGIFCAASFFITLEELVDILILISHRSLTRKYGAWTEEEEPVKIGRTGRGLDEKID